MNGDGDLRLELHHDGRGGTTTLSWDLETLTDAPGEHFVALDSDGDGRLLLEAEELLEIQQQAEQQVMNQ
jgi:hypothetical protein